MKRNPIAWQPAKVWSLLAFALLFYLQSPGQSFRWILEDSLFARGTALHELSDGSLLLAGQIEVRQPPNNNISAVNAFITKYDPGQNALWTRQLGGRERTRIQVIRKPDENFYAYAGLNEDSSFTETYHGYYAATDSSGNLLIARNTGSVLPITDMRFYEFDSVVFAAPMQPIFNKGTYFMSRSKHQINGNMLANVSVRTGVFMGAAFGEHALVTEDEGVIGTGLQNHPNFPANRGLMISRIRPNGSVFWSTNLANSGGEKGLFLAEMPDSSYLVLALSPMSRLILVKVDAWGNELWTKYLDSPAPVQTAKAWVEPNGDFLVYCNRSGSLGSYFFKVNDSLQIEWAHEFYDSQYGYMNFNDLHPSASGGYWLTGEVSTGNALVHRPLLIKTDNLGQIPCEQRSANLSLQDSSWQAITTAAINFIPLIENPSIPHRDTLISASSPLDCNALPCTHIASFSLSRDSLCREDSLLALYTGLPADSLIWLQNGIVLGQDDSLQLSGTQAANGGPLTLISYAGACSDSSSQSIHIIPDPTAGFSWQSSGLSVTFTDLSQGGIQSWNWDFGDGNSSSLSAPTHVFDSTGTYTVCLSSSNSCGTDSICQTLSVSCPAPQAGFSFADNGRDVQFTNLSTGGSTWSWDFGDGQNSSQSNPLHSYAQDGTYWVCLTASDSCGSHTVCDTLVILLDSQAKPQNLFSLGPNPSEGQLQIQSKVWYEMKVEFWDLRGKNLLSQKIPPGSRLNLDLSSWPKGAYLYRLSHGQQVLPPGKLLLR